MKVEKPIIIVGVGRSGSTAFHRIFPTHPNIVWLSTLCDRFPDAMSVNRFLMKAVDFPVIGRYLRTAFDPRECWDFWEHHCKGFSTPCRDLVAEDVTNRARERIQDVMSQMLTSKRNRLVIKITGWPRIGFLREIYTDAKFIHIVRDARGAVNSLINVDWWWGWRGPRNWRLDELAPPLREEWERHGKSFVALAAIGWKILIDATERAKTSIDSSDFMEIKYEDLCAEPTEVFENVVGFCDLEWSTEFEDSIAKYHLRSANYKWQKELTDRQQRIVEEILGDYLSKYGYM